MFSKQLMLRKVKAETELRSDHLVNRKPTISTNQAFLPNTNSLHLHVSLQRILLGEFDKIRHHQTFQDYVFRLQLRFLDLQLHAPLLLAQTPPTG